MLALFWRLWPQRCRRPQRASGIAVTLGIALFLMLSASGAQADGRHLGTGLSFATPGIALSTLLVEQPVEASPKLSPSSFAFASNIVAAREGGWCCEDAAYGQSTACSGASCIGCSLAQPVAASNVHPAAGTSVHAIPQQAVMFPTDPDADLRPPQPFL
ncbi:MAG: hypothetical protein EOR30_17750 [Mesorhizobium sp.]|uniref:hypothetical protein n=1 Tax=unclassified Mesorhizobium TaxID=325217 RepID=UPI000FCC4656|nr:MULTISPECIES: hypothetical protein [unclassified Mesorhizobium]RUV73217.1 hypothetical protein EOA78_12460 [Mesorhizobium sp. M5C.F.Cr.IN.023.01.1.1]RWF86640.1 MAG: hypothetical protein EOQ36_16385 [Mesorhizobium sp.]RWF95399.1 MAG: hypothetical protein EOQ45_08815 [Mesorhizobium sp.]RWI39763.1 MAG: hypothetical protein EOR14_16835 [Mesorhizobium sp.]RWI45370.1 MAG: hypothetical protein EOR15_23205 [Mesorhizobium sp.]